ncbi:cobalt-precorrin 5A hydrolase [Butyrivibrio sp. JL13D10]|uniref:cobalt-precorrin 5A hydrolase n=1 Tax=Butyrivibrio sp. JL13D10 TaxID=3236815 RepID=UPI0038B50DC6
METTEVNQFKIISFTDSGAELMNKLSDKLKKSESIETENSVLAEPIDDLKTWTEKCFKTGNVLIFIGAIGIAIRSIAPFIRDKASDPAVIVMDEKGEYVIPVLSGHIGGGVLFARKIAQMIGGTPVITTATDVEGLFSVDVFAKENGFIISDMKKAKEFSAKLLKNKTASFYIDDNCSHLPAVENACISGTYNSCSSEIENTYSELRKVENIVDNPDLIISPRLTDGRILQLIPKCVVIGMGCRKNMDYTHLFEFCNECLNEAGIDIRAVKAIVSADIKKDEHGLIELSKKLDASFITFSSKKLMEQKGDFSSSDFVKSVTGADNICERAVAAYGCEKIAVKKTAKDGMTFALGFIS